MALTKLTPLSRTCTWLTPLLSVAVPVTFTVASEFTGVSVGAAAGAVMVGVVGLVVSVKAEGSMMVAGAELGVPSVPPTGLCSFTVKVSLFSTASPEMIGMLIGCVLGPL